MSWANPLEFLKSHFIRNRGSKCLKSEHWTHWTCHPRGAIENRNPSRDMMHLENSLSLEECLWVWEHFHERQPASARAAWQPCRRPRVWVWFSVAILEMVNHASRLPAHPPRMTPQDIFKTLPWETDSYKATRCNDTDVTRKRTLEFS